MQADVATTFAAVRNPLAGADRRESVTFTYEEGVDPEYDWSHRSHLVIPDIVTVELELTWRSGLVEGTAEAPVITATRWQKTWGTSAISRLEGSVVCVEVEPGVTELQIQYNLDALGQGADTIEAYLEGYFASILALAHGEPLPVQEWGPHPWTPSTRPGSGRSCCATACSRRDLRGDDTRGAFRLRRCSIFIEGSPRGEWA